MSEKVKSLEDFNPTTRRYARTMLEAFPTHYSHYIEPPPRARIGLWDLVLSLLSVVLWVGVVILFARS